MLQLLRKQLDVIGARCHVKSPQRFRPSRRSVGAHHTTWRMHPSLPGSFATDEPRKPTATACCRKLHKLTCRWLAHGWGRARTPHRRRRMHGRTSCLEAPPGILLFCRPRNILKIQSFYNNTSALCKTLKALEHGKYCLDQ